MRRKPSRPPRPTRKACRLEKVISTLLERGEVPQNDLLATEVALADAVQKGLQAQNALAISRANYNRLAGRMLNRRSTAELFALPPMAGELEPLIQRAAGHAARN